MAFPTGLSKRYAFTIVLLVVSLILVYVTIRSGYHRDIHSAIKGYVARNGDTKQIQTSVGVTGGSIGNVGNPPRTSTSQEAPLAVRQPGAKVYRFDNGRITVGSSQYSLSSDELGKMSPADLDALYENVVLETTADCSTTRRFGRREDGGWDLCLVGIFSPQEPCFSFSFGINNIWEFDDEIAATYKCQVLTFDPSMSQASYMRSEKVVFFKEGLHSTKGTLNSWSVDSYLGFLKRFGAENYVIDILKMDIEASEWASLETAVRDGSLKNVKQLMLETHISQTGSVSDFQRYFALLKAFYDLGFRQWHHNWNFYGNYHSKYHQNQMQTCCHELYYININFLIDNRPARNAGGTQIVAPLTGVKITKGPSYSHADTIRNMNPASVPVTSLESVYFGIAEQQHIICPYSQRIGDAGDGGWDVCLSGPFNIKQSKPCVAFSFGINNIWTYDDQLADKFGCNVYMFDPSMSISDHQRKKTAWFYRTGLSSENKVETNGWKMRTLCKLFEELGYAEKTIDILKIDIEHWEWVSFEKAIEEGCLKRVKQFLFESHTSELVHQKSDYARLIRIWAGVFNLGFRTWKWHKNPASLFYRSAVPPHVQRACCYEHYLLNMNFVEL